MLHLYSFMFVRQYVWGPGGDNVHKDYICREGYLGYDFAYVILRLCPLPRMGDLLVASAASDVSQMHCC